jgi:hypothetical protein
MSGVQFDVDADPEPRGTGGGPDVPESMPETRAVGAMPTTKCVGYKLTANSFVGYKLTAKSVGHKLTTTSGREHSTKTVGLRPTTKPSTQSWGSMATDSSRWTTGSMLEHIQTSTSPPFNGGFSLGETADIADDGYLPVSEILRFACDAIKEMPPTGTAAKCC